MPSANHAPAVPIQFTTGAPKPEPDQDGSLALKLNMAKANTSNALAPKNKTISCVKRNQPAPSDDCLCGSVSGVPDALLRVRSE